MKRTAITLLALAAIAGAEARPPERGFRGFAEWSTSIFHSYYGAKKLTNCYTGVSIVFGYQCNPWLFAGAGLNMEYSPKRGDTYYSLYADGRADLKLGKLTPFVDLRVGYNMTHGDGIYLSPSLGYRFSWGRKVGANISVGYTLTGIANDVFGYTRNPYVSGGGSPSIIYTSIGIKHSYLSMFSFRAGIDF